MNASRRTGRVDLATRRAQVERGEMPAAQEVAEVGRGAEQAGSRLPHGRGRFTELRFMLCQAQKERQAAPSVAALHARNERIAGSSASSVKDAAVANTAA